MEQDTWFMISGLVMLFSFFQWIIQIDHKSFIIFITSTIFYLILLTWIIYDAYRPRRCVS
ncbi:MAG: hypothetical protein Dasosvirus3_34 [Dasosvirus sp.]|uniref:Uncharacterized protein n=1 Tax=Dasosvirus sp. TaxID=2487764 RepID=A0A3G4ZRH3_9VIRU|nr:MAG: hypothetical protein Dasosvirus3_34 [Dasosvirus sp.]